MASHLTDTEDALWDGLVSTLSDYTHSPLTQSRAEYLAVSASDLTGQSYSHLTTGYGGLLAAVATELSGATVSALTSSRAEMMATIVNNPPDLGGGEYSPYYVLFDGSAYLRRADPLTGPSVEDRGFARWLTVLNSADVGGTIMFKDSGSSVFFKVDGTGRFTAEMFGNEGGFIVFADGIALDVVNDILFAWDVGFGEGDKRAALYVNDVLFPLTIDADFGDTVDLDWSSFLNNDVCSTAVDPTATKYADVGFWIGYTIVESDNTITEVNRRKFIDGDGNPVDPASWPASPIIKFSGNAAAFATNQGSGGAFVLTDGSISDTTAP